MRENLSPSGQGVQTMEQTADNGLFAKIGPAVVGSPRSEGMTMFQEAHDPAHAGEAEAHAGEAAAHAGEAAAGAGEAARPVRTATRPERAAAARGAAHAGEAAAHAGEAAAHAGEAAHAAGHAAARDPYAPYRNLPINDRVSGYLRRAYATLTSNGPAKNDRITEAVPAGVTALTLTGTPIADLTLDTALNAGGVSGLATSAIHTGRLGLRYLFGKENPAAAEATSILQRGGFGDRILGPFNFITRWKAKRRLAKLGALEEAARIAADEYAFDSRTPEHLEPLYAKVRFAQEIGRQMKGFLGVGRHFDSATEAVRDRLTSLGRLSSMMEERLTRGMTELQRSVVEERTQGRMRWENFKLNAGLVWDRTVNAFLLPFGIIAGTIGLREAAAAAGRMKDAAVNWLADPNTKWDIAVKQNDVQNFFRIRQNDFWKPVLPVIDAIQNGVKSAVAAGRALLGLPIA